MGRSPCCSKEGLNRGAWTSSEDKILSDYIHSHGEGRWRSLPQRAGLKRCGKSCRLRWLNYLRPDIKRGNISEDEEDLIIRLHNLLGNRWSLIAGRLPGRTDNEIKNYWNTTMSKKNNQRIINDTASLRKSNNKKPSGNPMTKKKKEEEVAAATTPATRSKTNNNVIRTKATRCTKVLIPPHLQASPQPPGIMSTPTAASAAATNANVCMNPSPSSPPFWGDFEFDDKFFSDFLDDDGGHNIDKEFPFFQDSNEEDNNFFSALLNDQTTVPDQIAEPFLDPALLENLN